MLTVTSSNSVRSIKRTLSTVLLWSPLLNTDSEHLAKRGPTRAKMSRLALSWNGCSGFNKDGKAVQQYWRGFVVHKNFNRARNALLQCYAKRYVGLLVLVPSRIFNFKLETLTLLLLLTEIIYDKNPNCSENSWRRQERRAHENSAAHSAQIISLSDKILLADAVLMKKETEEMKTKNNNQISKMQEELNLHLHQQLSEPLAQVSKLESDYLKWGVVG